jgi:hypothetical protein
MVHSIIMHYLHKAKALCEGHVCPSVHISSPKLASRLNEISYFGVFTNGLCTNSDFFHTGITKFLLHTALKSNVIILHKEFICNKYY